MKKKMHISLFLVSFVIMGLEMTATRLIAPSFGNTVYTWGIVISLFLIGSSIGYVLGGRCSDHPKKEGYVLLFFLLSILFIACILPLKTWVLPKLYTLPSVLGTTIGVFILYFMPNLLLSALVPIFTKNALEKKLTGSEIGYLHTSSALGSVCGTLVSTFFLIPSFSIGTVLVLLNGLLAIGFFLYYYSEKIIPISLYFLAFALIFIPYLVQPETDDSLLFHQTSLYHDIYVYKHMNENGEEIRTLSFGNHDTIQGSLNLSQPNQHQFEYVNNIVNATDILTPHPENVFMIGHGIGSLTSHFENNNVRIKTAEIDPVIESVSRDYFDYKGNSVVIGDGRHLLQQEEPSLYDVVILDAFKNTSAIPFHLVTHEFFELINEKTTKDGLLFINAIGTPKDDEVLSSIYATLKSVYPFVYPMGKEEESLQNILFIASKSPIYTEDIPHMELLSLTTGEEIRDADTQLKVLQ